MESETQIHIDRQGRWWNGDSLLIHEGTLRYFKSNLHRGSDGHYFIRNHYGQRLEIGKILSVLGFPIFAEKASLEGGMIRLLLDSGETLDVRPEHLFVGGDDLLWTFHTLNPESPELPIPVRLRPAAMTEIGRHLEEGDEEAWQLRLSPGQETIRLRHLPPPRFPN